MSGPEDTDRPVVAIVGVGAVLPDAPDAGAFWSNLVDGRYSISEVPAERWNPDWYWDPDPAAPDRTYSKIGGWVREHEWDPMGWRMPIPPKVADAMDDAQKWAVSCTRAVLEDYGYPERPLPAERTAVIIGNAMAGENHYRTALRVDFPVLAEQFRASPSFQALPADVQHALIAEAHAGLRAEIPEITEDTMPGELANIIAGRVANLFDLHGPNFVTDAACASAMAALDAAIDGLAEHEFDAVITGGIDRNMGAATFVKFCKIGALSATGTRPYADGADGFVMGEGAALFLLKRLEDAERDGDDVYAVIRGVAGASDGRGKGITAPNPKGQRFAVERAWARAGLDPATAGYIEGHGTSTRVGDVVEFEGLSSVLFAAGAPPGSVGLGSVKSNIGHLKGAAGAAGVLKTVLALRHRHLPPSLGFAAPNPNIDFASSPLRVVDEGRDWEPNGAGVLRAGVSAFGFGGTNFHVVLEEHRPGVLTTRRRRTTAAVPRSGSTPVASGPTAGDVRISAPATARPAGGAKAPLRPAVVLGGVDEAAVAQQLRDVAVRAERGELPERRAPDPGVLDAPVRVAIDVGDAADLAATAARCADALDSGDPAAWRLLANRGAFVGRGPAAPVAFLFTGQGSQYVNMAAELARTEPLVAEVFADADRVMTPLLGRPLTELLFCDPEDSEGVDARTEELRRTEITQPAVLATDLALATLLDAYGMRPDMVIGHSLGEYGALVAAGSLGFDAALEAVSARGREMADLEIEDNGAMAAVMAPLDEVRSLVEDLGDEVVIANVNSTNQAVIGGATAPVEAAVAQLTERGHTAMRIPVSHAFHTSIVAPVSEPLRAALRRLDVREPVLPVVANVTGDFYPSGGDGDERMLDLLGRQVASPVQFVAGLERLYDAGARMFVEVGPKRALHGFAADVLGHHDDVVALFTNHPKQGDVVSFNRALCALWASGHGDRTSATAASTPTSPATPMTNREPAPSGPSGAATSMQDDTYLELGHLFAEFLERGRSVYEGRGAGPERAPGAGRGARRDDAPVVITGAALGLPGLPSVVSDDGLRHILDGDQLIDQLPETARHDLLDRRIVRLVKRAEGDPTFEPIDSLDDVIKLAGRSGSLDLTEFGVDADRDAALDVTTRLAIAVGVEALRDAGLPLVRSYRTTSVGSQLPEAWKLPEELRDRTGVVFASAFPGLDAAVGEVEAFHRDAARRDQVALLERLRERVEDDSDLAVELEHELHELRSDLDAAPFVFDRRFLFRVLAMGHAQFAELVGARGPNTQVNAACASTTQALAIAEDWIGAGRCDRVVVLAADDASSDHLVSWIGAGFLASGAAATDGVVEDAALPFDQRRHGMLLGMGAAALVVEHPDAAAERGLRPICEVLATSTANSAFHGTRLDQSHITSVMEATVSAAERRGAQRGAMAPEMVFVSHETYTPARGGSASAEISALRSVFGEDAGDIVIANTKGLTGHPMGAGIEDVVAVKSLETGLVPPVPNHREPDPELGELRLSQGGTYPVRYALRLAAGFGSQIAMSVLRWTPMPDGQHREPDELGFSYRIDDPAAWGAWLERIGGPGAELEVEHHWLRVVDRGPASRPAAPAIGSTPLPPPTAHSAPAASPAPAPAPTPGQATTSGPAVESGSDVVVDRVLAMVAEATGYPVDMLDPELDMEADLGIDTVKQAEVFGAIRESFGIERDDRLQLRDYPTLGHVVGFVRDRAEDLAPADAHTTAEPAVESGSDVVVDRVLAMVAEATGYPVDMLDPELDMEADLGIDTVKQAEVFGAIRESFGIERDDRLQLRDYPTLGHVVGFVRDRAEDLAPADAHTTAEPAVESGSDVVVDRVLAMVAEATGYPVDMLDPELDMEADLGIDTVKQAEVFGAIRESFGIERDDRLQLRDYPTLGHVVGFVRDRAEDLAPADAHTTPEPGTATAAAPHPSTAVLPEGDLDAANDVLRRTPVPELRPPLEQCAPSGVDLSVGSRILVVGLDGEADDAAEELIGRLEQLSCEVLRLDAAAEPDALVEQIRSWSDGAAINGCYWLPALSTEDPATGRDLDAFRRAIAPRVQLLHRTARQLLELNGATNAGDDADAPFLVAVTALGGLHGYGADGATAPLGGAVRGYTKAYAREHPDVLVKCVDVAADAPPAEIASSLVDETLADPGAVEVGLHDGHRWTVGLRVEPLDPSVGIDLPLDSDSVVVVTGAAGSIVAAIVADLARHSGATFHLLDLTPEPDRDDPDLVRLASDRPGLQRDLFERLTAAGERATPAAVERELAGLERLGAALAAIEAVEAAGGVAHYHQLDLRDPDSVADAIARVTAEHDRIDALVHAAGVEISRSIPDKDDEQFDLVFGVKADGWVNLMAAIDDLPIGATVVFSSVAGRFGNGGQVDYSAANDLLCAFTSAQRRLRPDTRGIALDWTAWADIGMATRGSIPTMMAAAGIDMLPAPAGVATVRRELGAGTASGELVVAGALGVLAAERHTGGGLAVGLDLRGGPLAGRLTSSGVYSGIRVETQLDPSIALLDDHRIDATPVLPGVIGMEAFSEAAALLWDVTGVEGSDDAVTLRDVEFAAPFKFYRDEPRSIIVSCHARTRDGRPVVDCELLGERQLAGDESVRTTTHFRGSVHLGAGGGASTNAAAPSHEGPTVDPDAIYAIYFHGPGFRVLASAWRDGDVTVGALAADLPSLGIDSAGLSTSPRLVELCFQTAGLCELADHGRFGLPAAVDELVVHRPDPDATGERWALVTPAGEGTYNCAVVDDAGELVLSVRGYHTVALPGSLDEALLAPLRAGLS